MIEKLELSYWVAPDGTRVSYISDQLFCERFNEVIEAVNRIDQQVDPGPEVPWYRRDPRSYPRTPDIAPSVPEAEPPEQDIIGNIRRLLQLPEPDLAVLYREDALKTRRYIPYDDSEIEMLRHLIHVELDRLAAAQPGKGV
jgi:hypothetical protein